MKGHYYFYLFLAIIFFLSARVLWSGWSAYIEAEEFEQAGQNERAIEYYARAARWYFPILGSHGKARDALLRFGEKAESLGNIEEAVRCYSEVRGSILGTRSILGMDQERLEKSNQGLARTLSKWSEKENRPYPEQTFLGALERDETPDPKISLLCSLLFILWVSATVLGFYISVNSEGKINYKRFGFTILISLLLLSSWLAALALA